MISSTLFLVLAAAAPQAEKAEPKPLVIPAKKHAGHNAQSVAISADGRYVAAGFGGPSNGRFPLKPNGGGVFVWERQTGKPIFSRGEYGDVIKVGFSSDGRYLAYSRLYTPGDSVEANATVLIDLNLKKVVHRSTSPAFAMSPTDDLMLIAGRKMEVFDLKTLKPERTIDVRSARAVAFSADGKTAAALCYYWSNNRGSPTGLAVFGPGEDKPRFLVKDDSLRQASAVAISPDGKHIVTGHVDGAAKIWPAENPKNPKRLGVDTNLAVFPFFADGGKTLVLATQPAGGVHWNYDRDEASGFDFKKEQTPPWSYLYRFDFPSQMPQRACRFDDAAFSTFYARFGSGRRFPEYNPARFAVSKDGKLLIAGCNGCCTVETSSGKLMQLFAPPDKASKTDRAD